jgi:hypothetical protein
MDRRARTGEVAVQPASTSSPAALVQPRYYQKKKRRKEVNLSLTDFTDHLMLSSSSIEERVQ